MQAHMEVISAPRPVRPPSTYNVMGLSKQQLIALRFVTMGDEPTDDNGNFPGGNKEFLAVRDSLHRLFASKT